MTVRDLVEKLEYMDPDSKVYIHWKPQHVGDKGSMPVIAVDWVGGSDTPPGGCVVISFARPEGQI